MTTLKLYPKQHYALASYIQLQDQAKKRKRRDVGEEGGGGGGEEPCGVRGREGKIAAHIMFRGEVLEEGKK